MTALTCILADDNLQSALEPLTQMTEIRTSDGRLMGTFLPAGATFSGEASGEIYRRARALFDPQEIERRVRLDEPCYTFQEVMAHLSSLGSK